MSISFQIVLQITCSIWLNSYWAHHCGDDNDLQKHRKWLQQKGLILVICAAMMPMWRHFYESNILNSSLQEALHWFSIGNKGCYRKVLGQNERLYDAIKPGI